MKPKAGASHVLVIGGANLDVKCVLQAPEVMHTSNPGRTVSSCGGVGRNVAENLARLGIPTRLVTAVGQDAFGTRLLADTAAAGVDVAGVLRSTSDTGTYTAVLGPEGELVIAVAAMAILDELTPAALGERSELLEEAALVIVDCNLRQDTLAFALSACARAGVPALVEPVSVSKAARLRAVLGAGQPVALCTPNRDELAALAGGDTSTDAGLLAACGGLRTLGAQNVWVRLGERGSLLSGPEGAHWLPALPVKVVDVTGAGDASLAAFTYALLQGHPPVLAAQYGHAAAALTLTTQHTVHPLLTLAALESLLEGASP